MTNLPLTLIHQKTRLLARVPVGSDVFQLAQNLAELCFQHGYSLTRWQHNGLDPDTNRWYVHFTWVIFKGIGKPKRRLREKRKKFAQFTVVSEGFTRKSVLYKSLMSLWHKFNEEVGYA